MHRVGECMGASNEPYRTERQPRLGRTTAWGPILIRRRFRLARNKSSCLEKRLLPHGGLSLHDYIPKIDVFVPSIYDLVVYVLFFLSRSVHFRPVKTAGDTINEQDLTIGFLRYAASVQSIALVGLVPLDFTTCLHSGARFDNANTIDIGQPLNLHCHIVQKQQNNDLIHPSLLEIF